MFRTTLSILVMVWMSASLTCTEDTPRDYSIYPSRGDRAATGDTAGGDSTAGDNLAGDPAGDPATGDPNSPGDPVNPGDPIPGDPSSPGDPIAGDPGGCTPGTADCTEFGYLRVCTAQRTWPIGVHCPFGCSTITGQLACNECWPGVDSCDGSTLQTCNYDGTLGDTTTCTHGCDTTSDPDRCNPPPAQPTIEIVNDLYGQVAGENDWGKLNTVIRVRIGATWNDVATHTGTSQELLFPGDFTTVTAWTYRIETGDSKIFDATGYAPNYFLYIQTGWWDAGDCTLTVPPVCDWEKHVSRVADCAPNPSTPTVCPNTTYKWAGVSVTEHTSGMQVVLLSDFLPPGNWCSSTFCN